MLVNDQNLCVGCMKPLDENGFCPSCHLEQDSYHPIPRCLLPGTILAERYVLGKVLGEGSFGITYIGWDQILGQRVAVKEYYPSDLVSRDVIRGTDKNVYVYESSAKEEYQENLDKFLNEARCLTRFNRLAGIVSVRDFFYENETAYIVMEFVSGMSVKEYVKQNGSMEGERVLSLMKPVMEALSLVHKTGMVHRDISPDNILLSEEGKLILIDFGSARMRNMEMTRSMTIVFKRGYSPEEQYRAKGKQGAWSDVYAICATMYFMLTAKTPEDAIERMIGAKMQSLMEKKEVKLEEKQKEAIMKGISIRAEDRYEDMEKLMQVLYGEDAVRERRKSRLRTLIKRVSCVGFVFIFIVSFAVIIMKGQKAEHSQSNRKSLPTAVTATAKPAIFEMPDCTGLTKKQAKEALSVLTDEGIKIKWEKKYSNIEKKGKVISQSPKPYVQWQKGEETEITITVSRGKKKTRVPELTGLNYKTARKKLERKNLKCRIIWKESSRKNGIVFHQSKKAGTDVSEKTKITLTVSRYVAPEPVPKKESKESESVDYAGVIS